MTYKCKRCGKSFGVNKEVKFCPYCGGSVRKTSTLQKTAVGKCGESLNWTLYNTGLLAVTGLGDIVDSSTVPYFFDQPWYECREMIQAVKINSGVTGIGRAAFAYCKNLKSITLSNSVTSIADDAFCSCGLTKLVLPANIFKVGYWSFQGCDGLKNIEVVNENSRYSSLDGVLFNKNQTELLYYPLGRQEPSYTIPATVTSIGEHSFASCKNLTHIIIPDTVTHIKEQAFDFCYNLKNIIIPDSITNIGNWAFQDCHNLINITIPNSEIGQGAFQGCRKLTDVTLDQGVTYIRDTTFRECEQLKNITIPATVINIAPLAFDKCNNIKNIYYSGSETDWKQIDIAYGNEALQNATIHYNSECKNKEI